MPEIINTIDVGPAPTSWVPYIFYGIIIVIIAVYIWSQWKTTSHTETFLRRGMNKIEAIVELTEKGDARAPAEDFTLGMITGEYVDAGRDIKKTMGHLTRAVRGVRDGQQRGAALAPDEFIVRRATDLHHVAAPFIEDMAVNAALFDLFNGAQETVIARDTTTRVADAAKADTRQKALEIVFAPTNVSDSQNVHDGTVLKNTRQIIDRMRRDGQGAEPDNGGNPLKQVRNFCTKYLDPQRRASAEKVLSEIEKGNDVYSLGSSEQEVLRLIWNRANHDSNRANKKLIREAVCDALVDCVDGQTDKPVCITGRATRLVGALATLDFDKQTDSVQTFEMYKNQIFEESKRLITRQIEQSKSGGDATMAKGAQLYEMNDPEIDNSAADILAEKTFKDNVKAAITEHVDSYADRLKPEDLAQVKQTCVVYAAVD